jgi:hypothetical protein
MQKITTNLTQQQPNNLNNKTMKLTILSAIAITSLATGAFGQQLILDNLSNTGAGGTSAAAQGLVYEKTGAVTTIFDMNSYNVGANVLLGSSQAALAEYTSFTPATDPKAYTGVSAGYFQLGTPQAYVTVPGAAGLGWVELQMWDYDSPNSTGTYASYAAAVAGNDPVATVIFQNPVSSATPPVPPSELVGMPAVILQTSVPEPGTFALAGLGIASLLAFRRRK